MGVTFSQTTQHGLSGEACGKILKGSELIRVGAESVTDGELHNAFQLNSISFCSDQLVLLL